MEECRTGGHDYEERIAGRVPRLHGERFPDVENVDVGSGNPDRCGSGRDGRHTYRSMVMSDKELKERKPGLCGSCQMNEGVKLVAKGRGGRIKSWRCQGCLNKNKPSWITGK